MNVTKNPIQLFFSFLFFFSSIAFATAAAIAFFHGAEYLERNKIEDNNEFYSKWTAVSVIVDKQSTVLSGLDGRGNF